MNFDDDFLEWWTDERLDDLDWKQTCKILYKQLYVLNEDLKYIYKLIPMKYKKLINNPNESPFFSIDQLEKPPTPEDYAAAKERMADLLEKIRK